MQLKASDGDLDSGKFSTDDQQWAALVERNPLADGVFWYAVQTTNIYCRPSCPSRLPKRQHVLFFNTTTDAEKIGFRPCKRCQPSGLSIGEVHAAIAEKACRRIESSAIAPKLAELAAEAAVSPFHFQRIFKAIVGMSPKKYSTAWREKKMRENIRHGGTISSAMFESGYDSSGRFYEDANRALGMNPSDYKHGGSRTLIRFAAGECSLGTVLVASTERGVCAISLGDDPNTLVQSLQEQFPKAQIVGGDTGYESVAAEVIAFVDNPRRDFHLPLDIQGTVFQQNVWQLLSRIPTGATVSYSDIAVVMGKPTAARAVAQACASNRIAVVIPCHRVVKSDGGVAGYRWGVDRKKLLLAKENDKEGKNTVRQ